MTALPRFSPGTKVYTKEGREYVVEVCDGGTVYCTAPGGAESEFPESALFTATEWAARADGRRDVSYTRLRQSRAYSAATVKLDPAAAEQFLAKADRLVAGLLDFTAYRVAERVLAEHGDGDMVAGLSIVKARNVFDDAAPEVRASLLAGVLNAAPETIVSAAHLGDNLMRAMIDQGLANQAEAFEDFCDRPRR